MDAHDIPEEPARRGSHTSASFCLDGPTEKYGCITPRTKSAGPRNSRKSWQHRQERQDAHGTVGVWIIFYAGSGLELKHVEKGKIELP